MLTDLELMELHVNVLYNHDQKNRITMVNEPPFEDAPKFFVGCTNAGNVVRYSNALDASIVQQLKQAIGKNSSINLGELINILSINRLFADLSIGPAYVFPDVRDRTHTQTIQVTHENKDLLKPYFPYTFEDFEYKQPCFVVVEDNIPVSLCCSARKTAKADEASVYTHEEYRGKGYGIDVTKAWAAEVQKQGRIALYSTSWDNFASQSLAKKLKLHQYGTDIHMS